MSDEEIRAKCLELSVQCSSWFAGYRGVKVPPIELANLMFLFIKTGETPDSPYWPLS